MARKSKPLSASSTRQAWLSQRLAEGVTDSTLIAQASAIFDVTELTVRNDLKCVYDRWVLIDQDNSGKHKARWLEIGLTLFEETRDAGRKSLQFGPAVQLYKTLAFVAGVLKTGSGDSPGMQGPDRTQPQDQAARERMDQISKNPAYAERLAEARRLGLIKG